MNGNDLQALLALAPDAIVVLDAAGRIVGANDNASELFGYASGEMNGLPATACIPEDAHHLHQRGLDAALVKAGRRPLPNGLRMRALRKNGEALPIDLMLSALERDGQALIVCSIRDASVRVQRETKLVETVEELERRLKASESDFRRTNDHFKLFLKNAPAAIALLDRQMRYLIVSDRWLQDYGLADRDIHGVSHYDVFPELPETWKEAHRRCLAGETIKSDEDCFVRLDGRIDWLRWELHPWRTNDGRIAGMLMFSELITARKDAEQALKKSYQQLELRVAERTAELERLKNDADRANTQKSWFVAAASHDLRQPLQAALAYLSVLSRKAGREDLEELSLKARQPLKAMSDILDVLLDISDLESGHVMPHLQDFALNDLLQQVIASALHQATGKGLRLACLPTDLAVHSDPKLLERIVSNFVTNAIRYTDKGLIGIYCEQTGDKVCISVTDTGIGIPPEAIDTIFEDHVQLGNPARDRRKGLGLGLSIAKRIADALGHRISVQSEVGTGSSFSIELPESLAATRAKAATAPEAPIPSQEHPVILLIDDDQDVAEAMQMLLQAYGFETYMAHSRDAALAMLESGLNPGLLLCDYRMPGVNGIDVIRQLRQVLNSDIPAVLMTGDMGLTETPADLNRCALLHKPVDVDLFIQVIGRLSA